MHKLIIKPYVRINNLYFSNSFDEVNKKLSYLNEKHIDIKFELSKRFPTIYIEKPDLLIVFTENSLGVRYFGLSCDVFHLKRNLFKDEISELKRIYVNMDPKIKIENDGFDSPKFGIRVFAGEDRNNNVLVYGEGYTEEKRLTPEDVIKYHLGDDI